MHMKCYIVQWMASEGWEVVYELDNDRYLPVKLPIFSIVNIYKHYHNNKIYVNEDLKSTYSSDQSDEWKNYICH
jgi:hypothetical protein